VGLEPLFRLQERCNSANLSLLVALCDPRFYPKAQSPLMGWKSGSFPESSCRMHRARNFRARRGWFKFKFTKRHNLWSDEYRGSLVSMKCIEFQSLMIQATLGTLWKVLHDEDSVICF